MARVGRSTLGRHFDDAVGSQAMPRYQDLARDLAERIVSGDQAPATFLPSVRDLAFREETTASTVARAYHELADAGVLVIDPRRAAQVTLDAVRAARSFLRRGAVFRLAGGDDPALSMLAASAADAIAAVGASGSYRGLVAQPRDGPTARRCICGTAAASTTLRSRSASFPGAIPCSFICGGASRV